jgi:hypothetical protein
MANSGHAARSMTPAVMPLPESGADSATAGEPFGKPVA